MVIKHNPVFIAEGLLGDPMKLFCRHRAVIVHFTVYVFRLSGQFKPGKIRGNIQIIDVAEYGQAGFKLLTNMGKPRLY